MAYKKEWWDACTDIQNEMALACQNQDVKI